MTQIEQPQQQPIQRQPSTPPQLLAGMRRRGNYIPVNENNNSIITTNNKNNNNNQSPIAATVPISPAKPFASRITSPPITNNAVSFSTLSLSNLNQRVSARTLEPQLASSNSHPHLGEFFF